MSTKFMVPLRVRNYHIDSYGHVNNAQYLILLEEARTQFMENAGCPLEGFIDKGMHIIVTEIDIKYKKPAVLGDYLEVYIWLPVMRKAKLTFQQEIRRAKSGEVIASAAVSCGWLKGDQVIPIPQDFLNIMQSYYIPDQPKDR